jgi:endoglucanase
VTGLLIWLLLVLVFSLRVAGKAGGSEIGSVQIKVDQVGYLPDGEKLAVVTTAAKTFEVRRASDNVAVFSGALGPASADADTGDPVQIADFTKLSEPGTYYLDVPGVGRSRSSGTCFRTPIWQCGRSMGSGAARRRTLVRNFLATTMPRAT